MKENSLAHWKLSRSELSAGTRGRGGSMTRNATNFLQQPLHTKCRFQKKTVRGALRPRSEGRLPTTSPSPSLPSRTGMPCLILNPDSVKKKSLADGKHKINADGKHRSLIMSTYRPTDLQDSFLQRNPIFRDQNMAIEIWTKFWNFAGKILE